ncbi:MAG: class F sortase [Ktedonobacterales bacterium]
MGERWRWRILSGAAVLLAMLLPLACGSATSVATSSRGASPPQPTPTYAANLVSSQSVLAASLRGLAPVRLLIPKMGLSAPILALGPDPNGGMQAPRIGGPTNPVWSEVYWWDAGAAPGEFGNAVIAGHVNRPDASPSTFTKLNLLVPGDLIQVVLANDRTLTFRVTDKNAPLVYVQGGSDPTVERIFGPSLTPNLNLMTCWGEWDGTEFNRRLVVYSTLVGSSPFPAQPNEVTVTNNG